MVTRCLSWSHLVLKTLIIHYVLRIKTVHFASSQAQIKFNTRHLSFTVTYTKSGINQAGFRFGIYGEGVGGVVSREDTAGRSVGLFCRRR